MNIRRIVTLLEYNYWANERVLQHVEQLTPAQLRASTIISHGTAFDVVRHMLDAEWSWRLFASGGPGEQYLWIGTALSTAADRTWRAHDSSRVSFMTEIERIVRLLEQTFEGKPYYGPSVLGALEHINAAVASRRPLWSAHSIWDIVTHLIAELIYAREVVENMAGPYGNTWPAVTDTSEAAWRTAISDLKRANRALVRAVQRLEDTVLERKPVRVRGPFYTMLHGTIQHNVYHAGQISLLAGQTAMGAVDGPT